MRSFGLEFKPDNESVGGSVVDGAEQVLVPPAHGRDVILPQVERYDFSGSFGWRDMRAGTLTIALGSQTLGTRVVVDIEEPGPGARDI